MATDEPRWEPWMDEILAREKEWEITGEIEFGASVAQAEAGWKRHEPTIRRDILADPDHYYKVYTEGRGAAGWQKSPPTRTADALLRGMHQLTHDDLIDMWQKAKSLPEPDRTKAIRYITHLSKQLESQPAAFLANILLEAAF